MILNGTARNLIEAAERASELPESIDAVRRGELSLDQLMPIVRKVPAWGDAQMVGLAKRLTVSQIRRAVNTMDWTWKPGPPDATEPDTTADAEADLDAAESDRNEKSDNARGRANIGEDEAALGNSVPPDSNRVWFGVGDDSRWHLHADLDLDLGEVIEAALTEARDALFHERATRNDERSPIDTTHRLRQGNGASRIRASDIINDVDAIVKIAQRSLDSIPTVARRSRFRINLYLDLDGTLTNDHEVVVPV
jgi:hypothetical protein